MIRFQTFFLLVSLIFISQAAQPVHAPPAAPAPAWKPGTYKGTITIKAKDHHSTPPDVEGHEEYTTHIPRTTGELQIRIAPRGNIEFRFEIPISFSTAQWDEVKDDGQGNCRGMVADSTGRGTLSLIAPSTLPVGDTFGWVPQKFTLPRSSFQPTVWHIGSNCDETNEDDMYKAIEAGLKKMLLNKLDFYVKPSENGAMEGSCTMFKWENDPERSFTCNWRVYLTPKKK